MTPVPVRRIVITGASRGLGLEFTRLWLAAGHQVYALARTAATAPSLGDLAQRHPVTLHRQACDVADDGAVAAAAVAVGKQFAAVDLLVNDAGIYGPGASQLEDLDLAAIREVFEVNTLGPLRVSRALLPLLRHGRQPRIVHLTSLMGSITDNSSGGAWAYRLSKAALNMLSRNLALELAPLGIASHVIHPGWVKTGMGGDAAPIAIADAAAAMVATIDGLLHEASGGFIDRHGQPLPW